MINLKVPQPTSVGGQRLANILHSINDEVDTSVCHTFNLRPYPLPTDESNTVYLAQNMNIFFWPKRNFRIFLKSVIQYSFFYLFFWKIGHLIFQNESSFRQFSRTALYRYLYLLGIKFSVFEIYRPNKEVPIQIADDFVLVGSDMAPHKNISFFFANLDCFLEKTKFSFVVPISAAQASPWCSSLTRSQMKRLHFVGNVCEDTFYSLIAECQFLLLTSTNESYSFPLHDARYLRTPVLAFDAEYVRGFGVGLYRSVEDIRFGDENCGARCSRNIPELNGAYELSRLMEGAYEVGRV